MKKKKTDKQRIRVISGKSKKKKRKKLEGKRKKM